MVIITNNHRVIAKHVTILTTTEDRTVNPSTSNINPSVLNISLLIKQHTWVTLTSTEEIASHWVSSNLTQGTRHTKSSRTAKVDCNTTFHVGQLISAINVSKNMSASDINHGIATNITRLPVPLTCGIWEIARSTAEDITIEGTSVGRSSSTTLRVVTSSASIFIMRSIWRFIPPTCTLRQR